MLRVSNECHLLLGSLVCNPRRVDESSVPEVPRVKGVWINERFVSMLMLVLAGGAARCVESEKIGRG